MIDEKQLNTLLARKEGRKIKNKNYKQNVCLRVFVKHSDPRISNIGLKKKRNKIKWNPSKTFHFIRRTNKS